MNPFEDLLKELGRYMELPLKPDAHQSCRLDFHEGLAVQIDLNPNADQLLIGAQLGRVDPGSFREKVLKSAMMANGKLTASHGILAYSDRQNTLVLYQFLPIASLTGEKLFHFLQMFVGRAKSWHHSLQQGSIPPEVEEISEQGSGFYGLRP